MRRQYDDRSLVVSSTDAVYRSLEQTATGYIALIGYPILHAEEKTWRVAFSAIDKTRYQRSYNSRHPGQPLTRSAGWGKYLCAKRGRSCGSRRLFFSYPPERRNS